MKEHGPSEVMRITEMKQGPLGETKRLQTPPREELEPPQEVQKPGKALLLYGFGPPLRVKTQGSEALTSPEVWGLGPSEEVRRPSESARRLTQEVHLSIEEVLTWLEQTGVTWTQLERARSLREEEQELGPSLSRGPSEGEDLTLTRLWASALADPLPGRKATWHQAWASTLGPLVEERRAWGQEQTQGSHEASLPRPEEVQTRRRPTRMGVPRRSCDAQTLREAQMKPGAEV